MRKKETKADELRELLQDKRLTLDCGHHFTLHPWSNTLIVTANGKTYCHNCY